MARSMASTNKVLIAIPACAKPEYSDRVQAVCNTWFKDVPQGVTARFFYGHELGVNDDYDHLPHKTIAICRWALVHGYTHLFKCDDDTYVWPSRLLAELQRKPFDYAGYLHGYVAFGGTGYWLSRRAMEKVRDNPDCTQEDVWVAKCMAAAGIEPVMLANHTTMHPVKPEDMREMYRRQHEIQCSPRISVGQ